MLALHLLSTITLHISLSFVIDSLICWHKKNTVILGTLIWTPHHQILRPPLCPPLVVCPFASRTIRWPLLLVDATYSVKCVSFLEPLGRIKSIWACMRPSLARSFATHPHCFCTQSLTLLENINRSMAHGVVEVHTKCSDSHRSLIV